VDYIAAKARFDSAYQPEKPGHWVTLAQPFYMGKFTVAQKQYQELIGSNPSTYKGKDNPVEMVSWNDAQAFCKTLTERVKQTVRLPAEVEWEFACRAGTTSTYDSGDSEAALDRVAWYCANSKIMTHPVGQREPNAFGLYDMHGNVCQWCQDWYDEYYYSKSPSENPEGAVPGTFRLLRGGSWRYLPVGCRSANRSESDSGNRRNDIGFRIAAPASP